MRLFRQKLLLQSENFNLMLVLDCEMMFNYWPWCEKSEFKVGAMTKARYMATGKKRKVAGVIQGWRLSIMLPR